MARLALYRKYRPRTFDELYGQDHIASTLKNSVMSGNFSHAYLFCGPRGTGKTSVARLLAKAINCETSKDGNPDNKCNSCDLITEDKTMDIIEIDAASHTQVDNIREIIVERAKFAPTNLKYKVYIIDEAHMLSKSSFNALLKTLEEPPEHTLFILATTEVNKILPTIVSRCQRFDFKRISLNDLVARLKFIAKEEKITIDDEALNLIAEISNGGFRDAISTLDQISSMTKEKITPESVNRLLGLSEGQAIEDLVFSLLKKEVNAALDIIEKQIENGHDTGSLFAGTLEYFRKLLIASLSSISNIEIENGNESKIAEILKVTNPGELVRGIDILIETEKNYKNSSIPQLGLEIASVKICKGINEVPAVTASVSVSKPKVKTSTPVVQKVAVNASDQVKWQQTLLEIKGRNNSIHAFLKVCDPEFEEEIVKLHFPYKFHKERIEDIKNRRVVEESLSKVVGKEYQVKCLLKPMVSVSQQVQEEKKDDLLEDALEIFGGEVME